MLIQKMMTLSTFLNFWAWVLELLLFGSRMQDKKQEKSMKTNLHLTHMMKEQGGLLELQD